MSTIKFGGFMYENVEIINIKYDGWIHISFKQKGELMRIIQDMNTCKTYLVTGSEDNKFLGYIHEWVILEV